MSSNSRSPCAGCGAAILRDSKLLLVKRKRPPETNYWVPGGKVDWLEPVVAAVAREIAEELGLAIRRSASLCVVDQIDGEHEEHWLAPICLVEDAVGEPRVLEPAALAGYGWFPLDELPAPLTRATQVAFALLQALCSSA